MTRTTRDVRLETRTARERLEQRQEPYWRAIDLGAHLGYYRGLQGGTWFARHYQNGRYIKHRLGLADDLQEADGLSVLTYSQAQEIARTWFAQQVRLAEGLEAVPTGPYTVADAVRDYLAWYGDHRKALYATTSVANTHILPKLHNEEVARLSAKKIRDWHTKLASDPARLRTRLGAKQNVRVVDTDRDAVRRRRATANRVLTVLKAALNHAWSEGKVPTDEAWRRVKPFHNVDAPVVRYLNAAECVRLVNSCAPDFRQLVRAALLTGCRFGELVALCTPDYNADAGTIVVRISKSGKVRHVFLTEEGRQFFDAITAGRRSAELMFLRADGEPWAASHQQRPMAEACKLARIEPAISFHILRHTHGSLLAMQAVPMSVIAHQLGHSDTRMTEKHYAHLAPSYVADAIRAGMPTLGITELRTTIKMSVRKHTISKQRLRVSA